VTENKPADGRHWILLFVLHHGILPGVSCTKPSSEATITMSRRAPPRDSNVLCRYKTYDVAAQSWSKDWTLLHRPPSAVEAAVHHDTSSLSCTSISIPCPRGQITLYPNVISTSDRHALHQELAHCGYFRAYGIQGTTEPRRHFLAHEMATTVRRMKSTAAAINKESASNGSCCS
jgi:hypothetical protein